MASNVTKAIAVSIFADYYTRFKSMKYADFDAPTIDLVNTWMANLAYLLDVVNTDGTYSIAFVEPRYTIVQPAIGTRPYKVKAGAAFSLTITTSDGETSSAAVWSISGNQSWLSMNSGSGALTGTVPAISSGTFNTNTGGQNLNLFDVLPPVVIGCSNAFGPAINNRLPLTIQVIDATTSVVSSAATGSGVHAGTLSAYTITASLTPTSFVAYGLEKLNLGTGGTVALNPATGVISGNCGSATVAGPVVIYVAAVNSKGEGLDQLVTITLS